ncbi:P2X purinoceptor 7-like [Engraulis encrasicolus]|uniref:P2X purinoceptor 7-like n=1 Tax=Engraulis encrasicolus TaxID=184585 RepID=UPI002FCF7075
MKMSPAKLIQEQLASSEPKDVSAGCSCGQCEAISSASLLGSVCCCRGVEAYRALLEKLDPSADIPCLTLHPDFKTFCLNPCMLEVAYLDFGQKHGPLQAKTPQQFRYTAYRQVVCWAHGVLDEHVRKAIPSCVVAAIRRRFPEEGGIYRGFQRPHLEVEK